MSGQYNDGLAAEDQIDTEELIASILFDERDEDGRLCEESCGQLGRTILLAVLAKFRPDLVE